PQRQHRRAGSEDRAGVRDNRVEDRVRTVRIEQAVAIVDYREAVAGTESPRINRPVEVDARRADAGRPEPRARPVSSGEIERHARDDDVGAGEVLGVTAAHERQYPGKGIFADVALKSRAGNGGIGGQGGVNHAWS